MTLFPNYTEDTPDTVLLYNKLKSGFNSVDHIATNIMDYGCAMYSSTEHKGKKFNIQEIHGDVYLNDALIHSLTEKDVFDKDYIEMILGKVKSCLINGKYQLFE